VETVLAACTGRLRLQNHRLTARRGPKRMVNMTPENESVQWAMPIRREHGPISSRRNGRSHAKWPYAAAVLSPGICARDLEGFVPCTRGTEAIAEPGGPMNEIRGGLPQL
jgi:hypothetical protein